MDVHHSVSVHNWAKKETLFTSRVDKVGGGRNAGNDLLVAFSCIKIHTSA